MRRKFMRLAAVFAALALVLGGCNYMSFSGSYVNLSKTFTNNSWALTAKSVNGNASRSVDLTAGNLAALRVSNTNSGGTVELVLTEGEGEGGVSQTYDITGPFDGAIDASAFSPGKISMRLNFSGAKDLDLKINW